MKKGKKQNKVRDLKVKKDVTGGGQHGHGVHHLGGGSKNLGGGASSLGGGASSLGGGASRN